MASDWPALIVPAVAVKALPSMAYSPPSMLMGAGASMPERVTALDVAHALRVTLNCGCSWNAFGVVSGAAVVTTKDADTPPTVNTTVIVVEKFCGADARTRIVCPFE